VTVEVRLHRFKGCGGPCMARAHRLGPPGCSARRTYERIVKPFGSTVKKEVRIEVERWKKICGYVAGVGNSKMRGKSPWGLGKGPKNFFEN